MLIESRPIAVSGAVFCFFAQAVIGILSGVSAVTCAQRSCLAALVTYGVIKVLVRVVNAILVKAVIDHYIIEHERQAEHERR